MKKLLIIILFLLTVNTISPIASNRTRNPLIAKRQLNELIKFATIDSIILLNTREKELIATYYLDKIPIFFPIKTNELKYISSDYGMRKHPIHKKWEFHKGIDLVASKNTDVISTCDGKVITTKKSKFGYGNRVVIKHRYNYKTLYAHLEDITVKKGQTIKRGEKIGTLGSTGFSTGPHLHYEIIKNNISIDPMFFTYNKKENRDKIKYFSKLIALEKL